MQSANGGFDTALAFWQQRLAGYVHPRPLWLDLGHSGSSSDSGLVKLAIGSSDLHRLRQTTAKHSSSVARLVTAAFARQIMRIVGQPDLLLSTTRKNRRHPGLERTVGSFVSIMPMRLTASAADDLSHAADGPAMTALIQQVNEASMFCRDHWAPQVNIMERCHLMEPSRNILSVLLNYRQAGNDDEVIKLGLAEAQPLTPLLANRSSGKVAAHCRESPDQLEINLTYCCSFLSSAAANAFASDLQVS